MKFYLYEKWKEQQIDQEAYRTYQTDIATYNLQTLRQIAWLGMCGGILLVIACLPPFHLLSMLWGYVILTVLFALLLLLSYTVLAKQVTYVLPGYYLFMILLLVISIIMGTFWGKDSNAITFVMLVVVLPLLVIDKPNRVNLIFGLLCVVFILIDDRVKTGDLRSMDISNCIVFYLLSIVISRQSINARLSDIIIKHELKLQRDMDMLTKLNNRGAFERHVEQYIHESNKNAVMLIMDLDNFKAVNDQMGHEYGDLVLKLVGEYMQAAFRKSDIVSRLGGDEFVAFLPAIGDMAIINEKVEQLLAQIAQVQQKLNLTCPIGASVGLACYPEDGCSFEELYRRADRALYHAKRQGKGTYVVYDENSFQEEASVI